ncbi:hypothetical protein [Tenacibaculum maritimum]|uniref:hypothetical protein n=1 Tax=Tenacibaculum maritimum TaxID=107401 RepID=UPI0038773BB0
MTIKGLENLMIERGIELKINDCDVYLSKFFFLSDMSTIKDIRKSSKDFFEEEILNTVFEFSNFLNDSKLMKKIVLNRGFDISLLISLEDNINALNVLLRYIKTKTNVKKKIEEASIKWKEEYIKEYNLKVVKSFRI